jgi:hypothetical protein
LVRYENRLILGVPYPLLQAKSALASIHVRFAPFMSDV